MFDFALYDMPIGRLTVNLALADVRKEGPSFYLSISKPVLDLFQSEINNLKYYSLSQAVMVLMGSENKPHRVDMGPLTQALYDIEEDFADVKGQSLDIARD